MPMPDGRLLPDEMQKISDYFTGLEKKAGRDLACEVCGTTLWEINPFLLGMGSDSPDFFRNTRYRSPSVMLFCSVCGNQKQFLAVKVGISPLLRMPEEEAMSDVAENPDGG